MSIDYPARFVTSAKFAFSPDGCSSKAVPSAFTQREAHGSSLQHLPIPHFRLTPPSLLQHGHLHSLALYHPPPPTSSRAYRPLFRSLVVCHHLSMRKKPTTTSTNAQELSRQFSHVRTAPAHSLTTRTTRLSSLPSSRRDGLISTLSELHHFLPYPDSSDAPTSLR